MKEELHLNRLTHIEKLDMFINVIREKKKTHQALWSIGESLPTKDAVELINMMHDYDEYFKEFPNIGELNVPESKYLGKLCDLYIKLEMDEVKRRNSTSIFSDERQMAHESEYMLSNLHIKMTILKRFIDSNKRIFKINELLIEKLKETDVNGDVSYIKIPYDAIYIQFPSKFSTYTYSEGVYVTKFDDDTFAYFVIDNSRFDPKTWANSRDIFTSATASLIDFRKKITIKDMVKNYKENNKQFDEIHGDEDTLLVSTIIKILMYISSINVDTEKRTPNLNIHTKKKKLLKKGKTTIPYEYVGGNIIINNNNNFVPGSGNGTGRQITTKFMVRGHYRGFWMNLNDDIPSHQIVDIKDDKMLVKKWVEPFWKGSEFAEVVLKDYKVI